MTSHRSTSPKPATSSVKPPQLFSVMMAAVKLALKNAIRWISNTTSGVGQAVNKFSNLPGLKNPFTRRIAGVLRLNWLLGIVSQVNVEKALSKVQAVQQQYPNESPSEIAHRLIVRKALDAGKIGFMSSLIPGVAVALLAIDLAATTALQTELVYEIAAAYGLDLHDPARRGEVLGIFGLAAGGGTAIKAGLGFLRNIPFAGTLIGASTNATVLYSVGYAASRFYEAKIAGETEEPTTEALERIQQQSERYLDVAIAQQTVMDQVLAHMILASYPNKTWEDILPELKTLQLEPNSLKTIESNLQSPQPIGALLQQLDCDFAIPLFSQCQQLAQHDRVVSEEEHRILDAIADRCGSQLTDAL